MRKQSFLWAIFWISLAGMIFSGFLSYTELVRNSCAIGGCSYVLGVSACVYGFVMYLALFLLSILGIRSK